MGADGGDHPLGLSTSWGLELSGAFRQLNVRTADNREEEVEPRRQFVFAVVPTVGTEPEAFVVGLSGFLNEAFQADVATDLVAVLVECQQGEQPGHATVAVPERVNAKEIQDEGGDGDERRDILLVEGMLVMLAEFFYSRWGLRGLHAAESDHRGLSGQELHDVVIDSFELAGVAAGGLAQGM